MLYDVAAAYASPAGEVGLSVSPHMLTGGLVVFAVGIVAGILSGLLGVGGGIIMVPAMVLLLGIDQRMAQGISLAVIIPVSVSGTVVHGAHGNVKLDVGIWLALGGVLGGLLGAGIAVGTDPLILRGMFGLLMLIMGILSLVRKPRPDQARPTPRDAADTLGS
jgi:hypothetical protein